MTEELKQDTISKQDRQQRFLKVSLLIVAGLMVLTDISMFIFGVTPNNWIILIMLVPVVISVRLAFLGKSSQAGWCLAGANIFGIFAETLTNPRSPLVLDVLISQYLPTLVFVIPVAIWGLNNKKQRTVIILGTILGAIIAGFIGHTFDQGVSTEIDPAFSSVVNILWVLALLVLNYFFVRNFASNLQWYLNRPLRFKLIFSMVMVIVLGSAAITTVQVIQSTDQLRESTSSALQNMADRHAAEMGQIVSSRLEMMTSMAISSSVIELVNEQNASYSDMSEAEILVEMERLDASWERASDSSYLVREKLLNELANEAAELKAFNQGEFLEVFFTDKYGGLAGTSDRTSDYYQADEGWWQAAYNNGYGASYIGQMEYDESTDAYAVNMAVPVYDRETREVIGVMRITYDISLQLLVMDLRGETLGEGTEMEMVFGDGQHVHHGVLGQTSEDDHAVLHEWSLTDETLFWDGTNKYAGLSRVSDDKFPQIVDLDWEILVTQDVEVVTGEIQASVLASMGVGLVVILAGVALAAFLGQTISRPVLALTDVATKFAGGDYSAQAEITSEDEIGQLATAFNQMAAEVGQQTVALAERAREMEASQRVTFAASERTTPEDFLNLLVNLIADQFDVYHCQVYLVDEDKNQAVLSQSTGYAGRQLLQRGHAIPLEAQSLVTQCINTGESVLVAETTKDPTWLPNPMLPLTQSELVVPLKIDDKVIGAMDIQDRVPNRFMEASVPVFESMTEQVAFLYENNELLEEIAEAQQVQEQFVNQLETTSEVAGQLTTILDPTQLLDQAVTMLQSRFSFYHAHIYLLDEAKENLVVTSGSGHVGVILKERGHSIPVDAERSFVARAFREASAVRVADTTQDINWLPNPLLPDTRAEMAVPLITRGQVIGVLDIQDEVAGRFTEVDEDTMLTLAGQLATSVDTARLFVDVEQAADRDRTRFEIAEALSGNPIEEEVWDILLEKAMDENVVVTLSLAEFTEDGGVKTVTHRSASSTPALEAPPVGYTMVIPDDPDYKVLDLKEVFISNDIENDERMRPESRKGIASLGVVSMLTTPITISDEDDWQGGVIRVGSSQLDFFDENQVSRYRTLIELGTVALRAARLRSAVADAADRDRTRFEIAEALSGNPTEDQVWDILLEKSMGDNVAVSWSLAEFLEDGSVNTVTHRSGSNDPKISATPVGSTFTVKNDPEYGLLDYDEVFISNNVSEDERIRPASREMLTAVGVVSSLTTPITISDEGGWQGGVIRVDSSQSDFFDEAQESKYRTLIELGSVALRAARLRSAVADAAERDRTRFEIAEALSGNLTEEEVWDVLIEKAKFDNTFVLFLKADQTEDGDLSAIIHRKASDIPGIMEQTPPIGSNLDLFEAVPGYNEFLNSGGIVLSNNLSDAEGFDPEERESLLQQGVSSVLLAPIFIASDVENKWHGFLNVTSREKDYFDAERLGLVEDLIASGSVALHAARLRAAVADAADRDRTRFEIAEALSGNPTEDQVWDILLEKSMGDNVAVSWSLAEFSEDGNVNAITHRSGSNDPKISATPVGSTFVIENDPEYKILDHDEVFITNNVSEDERIRPTAREMLTAVGVVSSLTTPITISDEGGWQGGVIRVDSSQSDFFDEAQESKYKTLIELGSVALRAARLRSAVEQAADRDRTRFEIAEALAGTPTEDEIWQILIEKAMGENLMVGIEKVERLEDGTLVGITIHAESSDPSLSPPKKGSQTEISRFPGHEVLSRGGKLVYNDISTGEDIPADLLELTKSLGIKSFMAAAFLAPESSEWIGGITLSSSIPGYFTPERTSLYDDLIAQGTVALRAARLRAEAVAREERFRALFNYSVDAVLVLDTETIKWKDANANASTLFGLPYEELMEIGPVELSPETQPGGGKSIDLAGELISEAIATNTNQFEWVHRDVTGREFDCEIRLALLPGDNKQLLVNITDITQRKAAQQAIVQGDRLKSEFLANMSHELRTPLNSILGYTDVLLMGLDGELDEEVTTDLEAIHENSQHLLNLINDILDLAKIEAGRMTFEVGEVNVPHLLSEVKKTSAGLLVNKDVEMLIEADKKLPQMMADYHRVYQVVNNLVSNAVKFTEKGTITLRALAEGDEMVLQVEDTGIGISAEDLEVIFEEFTQADTSSTRQHEGTGLGLTITRRLVQMHGGTITVESEVGKGSTFTARFPMQAKVDPELLIVAQSANGNK